MIGGTYGGHITLKTAPKEAVMQAIANQKDPADADNVHNDYGNCDTLGPKGECAECKRQDINEKANVEFLNWLRGER